MSSHSTLPHRVLVTGATGFIGRHLVPQLVSRGYHPVLAVRNATKARALFGPAAEVLADLAELERHEPVEAVVNLAGEPIAGGLWTKRRRAVLLGSRIGVTAELRSRLERLATRPATWINASAIGYYGARDDEELTEAASAGRGFQAELCRRWEQAAREVSALGACVSVVRFGVVLGSDGGALPALARPVRLYAGTVLGTGRQWLSWIHVEDLIALLMFALERRTLTGAINATAPMPVRYDEFMAALAAALRRPLWPLHVPSGLVRLALGELAELFVDGQRVLPARATELGFAFRYPNVTAALAAIYGGASLSATE
jgi:uncharacterized protein (TIGR01777 family)